MLFSVIIPAFNRLALLKRTLESVWMQTFMDYEVIVVDDGSTDDTASWLQSQADRIRIFSQSNKGPGSARNLGANQARGEYLAFLDSDDIWFPWTLATFSRAIAQFAQSAILGACLVDFVEETDLAATPASPMQALAYQDYFSSHDSGFFVGAGMSVLKRDLFLATGGYTDHPVNSEDHDLILRMGDAPGFVKLA